MTHGILTFIPILTLLSRARASSFFINAAPSGEILPWKTTVTLTCLWDPTTAGPSAEFVIDTTSIWNAESPYNITGNDTSKAEMQVDLSRGEAVLTIKDLRATDSAQISCSVSRMGLTKVPYNLVVLEPPTIAVSGIATSAVSYTTANVSFDSVEGATKYRVGVQAAGAAAWEDGIETTATSLDLSDLLVATVYTLRVEAGNDAGYRDDVELTTHTFTTRDNRPPLPVDSLSVGTPDYNATDITLTWSLTNNLASRLNINTIIAKVEQYGVVLETVDAEQTLDGDATQAHFSLPGPGTYEFIVSTHNEFSGDTAAAISHIVEETRIPTTAPPTTPAPNTTQPDVTTANRTTTRQNVVETAAGGEQLKCSDPSKGSNQYNTSPMVKESVPGKPLVVACYLSQSSSLTSDEIKWDYSGGTPMNQDELIANKAMSIVADTAKGKSSFSIETVAANHAGIYTCRVGEEECKFQLTVTGMSVGGTGVSVRHSISTLLFLGCAALLHLLS